MKQFSTESGLKGWWLHKFAGFLYSVYLIAQVVDKYIVCAVKDESDIGAPGIAPKGSADTPFANPVRRGFHARQDS